MHICTFYAFKDGVGRTQTLINIAAHLVRSGKRVLMVDFDLRAPGLDSIKAVSTKKPKPGIVEFVDLYLRDSQVPEVDQFISESRFNNNLLLMSAGLNKPSYSSKTVRIDWQNLYDYREGYLLFEDLKAQWNSKIHADYVLIDASPGYSITSGITARHIPDSVVLMFQPNKQHARGLKKIVKGIRDEADSQRRKNIFLHYAMSNVPFLANEDNIIVDFLESIQASVSSQACHVIHRYDNLSILQQSILSSQRSSKLIKEYEYLSHEIRRNSLAT